MARKETVRTIRRGAFQCPECRTETDYDLQEVVVRNTFLGIPLGAAETPFRRVVCRRCDRLFPESVLQTRRDPAPPPRSPAPANPLAPIAEGHIAARSPEMGAMPSGADHFRFGDRVLGRWDFFWYPGTVGARDARGIKVNFDDGDEGVFPPQMVMPLDLKEGERVFARWNSGAEYAPGHIAEISGEDVTIEYDDGRREETTIRVVRVVRGEEENPWREGDRVFAFWPPSRFLFFPGVISSIREEIFFDIEYDDGDHGVCFPDQLMPIHLSQGDLIFIRTRNSGMQPGDLEEQQGDNLKVRVWSSNRVERAKLASIATMPPNLAAAFRKAQRP